MTTYVDINIHNAANDDSVMQSLNNFSLLLQYGENYPWEELHETKMILNQAFSDYQELLRILAMYRKNNPDTLE